MPVVLKKIALYFLLISVCSFIENKSSAQAIVQKLDVFRKQYPQEKVYLQLNKSFFLAGDTIYCKAYVVDAENNMASDLSNILYIDIIYNNRNIVKTVLLPVTDGTAWGTIANAQSLQEGHYRIRAYTAWMRNFDDAFFFETSITVFTAEANKNQPATSTHTAYAFRFFPEGGQLVNGLLSRVAFKAVGSNGLGVAVSGIVTDENGRQGAVFSSDYKGIGSFLFTPQSTHTYKAKVRYADGREETVPLPGVEASGYVMMIENKNEDAIQIAISAKNKPDDVVLVAQHNHRILYNQKQKLSNGVAVTNVSPNKFPSGIVQFTLFDNTGMPVSERLVFINHNDALKIHVSTDKSFYKRREKVKMQLQVTNENDEPIKGNFSIAVTSEATAPLDSMNEPTIITNLLLSSDLKGYIETSAYYFTNEDSNKINALDNLMLTQGWRRFRWNDLAANRYPNITFPAEKNLALTGTINNNNGKPIAGAMVSLLSKSGNNFMLHATSDSAGNFIFNQLNFTDSAGFVVQAVKPNESNDNIKIVLHSFTPPPVSEAMLAVNKTILNSNQAYQQQGKKTIEERKKYGLITDNASPLKNVTVTATKLSKVQQAVAPSLNLNGPGHADQILTYDDIPNCHDLTQCLPGKLAGVVFKTVWDDNGVPHTKLYSRGESKPMLIVIDGVGGGSSISDIQAQDVQSIEVLRSGGYLAAYGFNGSGGVLVITTKKGDLDYNHLDDNKPQKGILFTTLTGYANSREFYSPDYSVTNNTSVPDLRSTIYWQPNVTTDEDGKASIEFFNADATGIYNVIVEGTDNNGKLGHALFSYEVR